MESKKNFNPKHFRKYNRSHNYAAISAVNRGMDQGPRIEFTIFMKFISVLMRSIHDKSEEKNIGSLFDPADQVKAVRANKVFHDEILQLFDGKTDSDKIINFLTIFKSFRSEILRETINELYGEEKINYDTIVRILATGNERLDLKKFIKKNYPRTKYPFDIQFIKIGKSWNRSLNHIREEIGAIGTSQGESKNDEEAVDAILDGINSSLLEEDELFDQRATFKRETITEIIEKAIKTGEDPTDILESYRELDIQNKKDSIRDILSSTLDEETFRRLLIEFESGTLIPAEEIDKSRGKTIQSVLESDPSIKDYIICPDEVIAKELKKNKSKVVSKGLDNFTKDD